MKFRNGKKYLNKNWIFYYKSLINEFFERRSIVYLLYLMVYASWIIIQGHILKVTINFGNIKLKKHVAYLILRLSH